MEGLGVDKRDYLISSIKDPVPTKKVHCVLLRIIWIPIATKDQYNLRSTTTWSFFFIFIFVSQGHERFHLLTNSPSRPRRPTLSPSLLIHTSSCLSDRTKNHEGTGHQFDIYPSRSRYYTVPATV